MPSGDNAFDQFSPEPERRAPAERPVNSPPPAPNREKSQEPPPTDRGYDALAKVLGFQPREKVRSQEVWKNKLEAGLVDPDKTPSFLLLKAQAEQWIDSSITVPIGKSTEAEHQAEVAVKRAQYKAELSNLLAEYQSRWEATLIAKRIETHMRNTGESPIPPDKITKYRVKEVPVKTEGQTGVDVIDVIYDPEADPDVIDRATEKVKFAHALFRDFKNRPDRIISPVIFRGPDTDRQDNYRSHVTITDPPISVINLNNPDNMGIASHETIHQILIEQFGFPLNADFTEGIAMRLGQALNPKAAGEYSTNLPVELLMNLHPAPGTELVEVDSATHLLSELKKQGIDADQYASYFPYIFGYAFMDSFLKSEAYQEASRQAKRRGENIYQPIFKLNEDLTYQTLMSDGIIHRDPQGNITTKQREMLIHVLRKNGYNPEEILKGTTAAMKKWIR